MTTGQRVELCGEQLPKAMVDRRGGDDYSRRPSRLFYVVCQLIKGHEGDHVGHHFGRQVHWETTAAGEPLPSTEHVEKPSS